MIDGVSGVHVLELLTDGAGDHAEAASAANGRGAPAPAADDDGWLASALGAAVHPRRTLARVQEAVRAGSALAGLALAPGAAFPWNGPIGPERAVRWQTFELDHLRAMRAAAGCKINDVALAISAGALRSLLPAESRTPGRRARALVPVDVRPPDDLTLGNRFSGRFASLPVDVADPRERLRLLGDEMQGQKKVRGVQPFDVALAVAGTLPAAVAPWVVRLNGQRPIVHTVCTNVPGPREPRRVAGVDVLAIHAVVPLAAGVGLGFAMLSYAGTFSIVATADPALVPEVDRVPDALAAAADELAVSLGIAPARVPAAAAVAPAAVQAAGAVTTVGDLMTRAVATITPETHLNEVWSLMRSRRVRHVPVVDAGGSLCGLVSHRDVLAALPSSLGTRSGRGTGLLAFGWAEARDIMETHLSTATADEPARAAGRRMASQKIGCLPVVGARGELVGLLTETDLVRWATERS
jgi:CBS domain-containing protein